MATRQQPAQDEGDQEKPFDGGTGFFGPPNDERSGPGRVVAAFEVPEEGPADEGSSEPVQLECIDAEWFGSHRWHLDWMLWNEPDGPAPLSVLEFTQTPEWVAPAGVPGSIAWYQVEYEPTTSNRQDGRLYTNLFSAGTPVRIRDAERIQGGDHRLLPWYPWYPSYPMLNPAPDRFSPWAFDILPTYEDGPREAHYADIAVSYVETQLRSMLARRNSSKGVAIYDVGQGNWQAILHGKTGKPFAYVDVGGGVLYNRRTFPKDFKRPPFVPLVVLSHWDWDHWSSAARYRSLLKATWIAPSLSPKPIQRRFAMDIIRHGTLHALPRGWTGSMQHGCLRLEGCSGKTENDRGLAATVYSRRKNGRTCLLPGDAAYRYIASVAGSSPEQFDALCMSHHGGRLHSNDYPAPEPKAVAANSAGPGNTYRHPLFKTLAEHKGKGWPMPIQTGLSGSRPCHVFLPWGKKPQLIHGTCDVASGTGLTV